MEYFTVGQSRTSAFSGNPKGTIRKCAGIAGDWGPDLVHFHGTEHFYGLLLARQMIDVPCIISIQGLLGPYCKEYFGSLSLGDIVRSQRLSEALRGSGLIWDYYRRKRDARREAEIIRATEALAGRTTWDRTYVRKINPEARYYRVGEILREPFYRAAWDLSECRRHNIIYTNAGDPSRGIEVLLRAVILLKSDFPEVGLRLAGHIGSKRGYHRFLRRLVGTSGVSDRVDYLGYLDAECMSRELSRAHVFVIASHLENSPNSLCEAMLVGMPCVASRAGGIPSLVEEGRTGLVCTPGDPAMLAERVKSIFVNDELAFLLGRAAREAAARRHSADSVVRQLIHAYKGVLGHRR